MDLVSKKNIFEKWTWFQKNVLKKMDLISKNV